jgi:CBS domain-containing protein
MQTMAHVLAAKGARIWSISPDATVFEGLQIMAQKDIGALVVMERGQPIGVVSERDYTRKVILRRRSSHETPVRMIMTTPFEAVPPHWGIDACMALMTSRHTRHVLVMDGDELCGLVSIGDVVKATIEEQQFTIGQLEHYISS